MAKPDKVHRGITWQDFPGNCDAMMRKLAFAEFCRGTHVFCGASEGLEGEALKSKLKELAGSKRMKWRRAGFRMKRETILTET